MHILQIGLPKSGNFWLYNIINNIIDEAHSENKSFIQNQPIYEIAKTWNLQVKEQVDINMLDITNELPFYRIGNIFRYPIDNLDDYINNCTHVWCHSWVGNLTAEVCNKFDKVIYIIRDPRDVAISWSKFVFTNYMRKYYHFLTTDETNPDDYLEHNIKIILSDWVNHVMGYLQCYQQLGIYIIFYERLLDNFSQELEQLLAYLNIELNQESLDNIKHNVDFNTMKKDNPNHIRKGQSKQWFTTLTPRQKQDCLEVAKPLLKLLQYPLDDQVNNEANILPQLPENLTEMTLNNLRQNMNLIAHKVQLLKPSNH